jgi:2-desacetyl-2-hydroxyethyl bacteriochlorophyllide A dehydrogenase
MSDTERNPETSVVIRTFNEALHLPALFESLRGQRYQDFEAIVVDSGSIDGTREISREASARVIRIDRSHFTFGYSLNTGISAARGQLVAIVSAHTLPANEDWLGNLVAALREPGVAMVYGRQLGARTSKFSETQDFRRLFGAERKILRPPHFFANNANAAIVRELWEQYPFDEALPGLEDLDWARKWMLEGHKVIYEPAAALYHIHEENPSQIQHRYYREATAARRLGIKNRTTALAELGRETGYLAADLWLALRAGRRRKVDAPLLQCAQEIVSFRVNKTVGTLRGLLDGKALADPRMRDKLFFESSFDAVVIDGPGHASLTRIEMPEMRPGDVVIKVEYVGVCRTDLEIFDGTLNYFSNGLGSYPIVPGHEMSGRVVAMGAAVSRFQEGDPVVVECIQGCDACPQCLRQNWIGCADHRELGVLRAQGACARYVVVPNRFVHKLPPGVELARGALCEPLAVVLKGVDRLSRTWAGGKANKACAVIGVGPLGRLCALVLAYLGHQVTAFDRDPRRLADLRHSAISTADSLDRLAEFDAVVEATGDAGALEAILSHSGAGSTTLLIGLPYARKEFNFEKLVAYDRAVLGSVGSSAEHFTRAISLLPHLPLEPYLRNVMPLESFAEAWDLVRRHECLKVMLRVD